MGEPSSSGRSSSDFSLLPFVCVQLPCFPRRKNQIDLAVLFSPRRCAVGIEVLAGVHHASTRVLKRYRRLVEPVLCSPAAITLQHVSPPLPHPRTLAPGALWGPRKMSSFAFILTLSPPRPPPRQAKSLVPSWLRNLLLFGVLLLTLLGTQSAPLPLSSIGDFVEGLEEFSVFRGSAISTRDAGCMLFMLFPHAFRFADESRPCLAHELA